MSYVIADTETKMIVSEGFNTLGAAKCSLTALKKREAKRNAWREERGERPYVKSTNYKPMSLEEYNTTLRTTKKVRNLLSGTEIEIDINTPACCDPSTETYWSC